VHVFRNETNSILGNSTNRHVVLLNHAEKFHPDWVQLRAADVIFSHGAKDLYRSQVEMLDNRGVGLISFPYVHLWRSNYWYRVDGIWGKQAASHTQSTLWKFNKNYKWKESHKVASFHQGTNRPSDLGFGKNVTVGGINTDIPKPWPIVLLHLGHTTHKKKEVKFIYTMEKAKLTAKMGRASAVPPPAAMPSPSNWLNYNGYKGFHEFNIKLEKVPQIWFEEPIPDTIKPVPESFFNVINKYNPKAAKEYQELFNRTFGGK